MAGFVKRWDVDTILNNLTACSAQANSSYNDGFTAWACKQDLYRVKFAVDEMLKQAPAFAPEAEWLREHDKQKVWKALNDKM